MIELQIMYSLLCVMYYKSRIRHIYDEGYILYEMAVLARYTVSSEPELAPEFALLRYASSCSSCEPLRVKKPRHDGLAHDEQRADPGKMDARQRILLYRYTAKKT